MALEYFAEGASNDAPFTLKLHRGESMVLLAMDWRAGPPPEDFVGFAIEYKEPNSTKYWPLKNRLSFLGTEGEVNPEMLSTRFSPIQKFRWVHFPMNAELAGEYRYRVTPVFMNERDELSYGESQSASIQLGIDTYANELNVAFTRGFVSSQAFVRHYQRKGPISQLLPPKSSEGLRFKPTHPEAAKALRWMGFEARNAVLKVLDEAYEDETAQVFVVAYDLSEPEVVRRLEKLGDRLKIIIDDSGEHGHDDSGESQASDILVASAGHDHVRRQHMQKLQHNKTIVVQGEKVQAVVCGSTNYSWRGFYVQSNNAVVMRGTVPVAKFLEAFEAYWPGDPVAFEKQGSLTQWTSLGLPNVNAKVTFSPHPEVGGVLGEIAADVESAQTSVLFSLAFLHQTQGALREAIVDGLMARPDVFVYGMSDNEIKGLDLDTAKGHYRLTEPEVLGEDAPEPFASEPGGGGGIRMHHKFIVVDFDTDDARVYMGSYNFSVAADLHNGENLLLIRDRRVVTAYMVEALRLFDHYEFRLKRKKSAEAGETRLFLRKPPREDGEQAWWAKYWVDERRIRERKLFT